MNEITVAIIPMLLFTQMLSLVLEYLYFYQHGLKLHCAIYISSYNLRKDDEKNCLG